MAFRHRENIAAILAGIVLVGYISFLLVTNYRSQAELRKSTFARLTQDMDSRAAAVGYFASERVSDISELAAGNALTFFFTNKALGMSMKYGLSANLEDIAASFDRLIKERHLGEDAIYDRIDFIGADNDIHVHRELDRAPRLSRAELMKFVGAEDHDTGITIYTRAHTSHMVISRPYVFKGENRGQIITWVNIDAVYNHLIRVSEGTSNRSIYVAENNRYIPLLSYGAESMDISHLPAADTIPLISAHRYTAHAGGGSGSEMLALRVPVANTPFFLVAVLPQRELFGQAELWRLFLFLGVISVIVVISIGALLRFKDQNLILGIRLDESRKRQEEIAEKNVRLSREITERSAIEVALRASEKKYRQLYESMRDGFVCADMDQAILECNLAFREMFGYQENEILARNLGSLSQGSSFTGEANSVSDQILTRGYSDIYENILIRKDGSVFPVEVRTYLLSDETGKATGTWAIVKDISERKQAEDDLKRAKEAAEAANRAKSEFLANMSHELRTPLNHIIGFTELVAYKHFGELNAEQEEYLGDALKSSRLLLSLINDILDISKVEAGKIELDVSMLNLRNLLENSLTMIKEKAMRHNLEISTEIEDIPETFLADERKVKQILYNLLSNAAKFTPSGGAIRLSACCRESADGVINTGDGRAIAWPAGNGGGDRRKNRQYVEIAVKDTGIGIKEKDLHRIFDPFEQADNSTTRKYDGTGLGLSLSKNLATLHGGVIWAESSGEGAGSTFLVALPMPAEPISPQPMVKPSSNDGIRSRRKR